jgi:signal peptidase I
MGEETKTGLAILAAFCTAIIIKLFLFDLVITEGASMAPAIKPGSVLMVGKIAYGFRFPWSDTYVVQWSVPKEGDVVVFYTPTGVTAVKRCAGLTDNNEFIARGDNQAVSFDSATYGPVPVASIIGKALGVR